MRLLACLLVVLCGCHPAAAPQNPSRIDEVGWLEGDWGSNDDQVWTEEHWIAPRGATMLGTHRAVKEEKTIFVAFLRIEASPTDILYWAAPDGGEPTPFRLVKVEGQRAQFFNASHDYPQWIIYERSGGTLKARIEGTDHGVPRSTEWIWHRL